MIRNKSVEHCRFFLRHTYFIFEKYKKQDAHAAFREHSASILTKTIY